MRCICLADGLLEQQFGQRPVVAADCGVGLRHGVVVRQVRDLVRLLGRLGLVLLEQGQGFGLVWGVEADDLGQSLGGLARGLVALIVGRQVGQLGEQVLGELELHAQPFLRGALVGKCGQPTGRLVHRKGILLALPEHDDPEVADLPLQRLELRIGVLHQLIVETHRLAQVALLLQALPLQHSRVKAGELGAVAVEKIFESLRGVVEDPIALLGAGCVGLGILVLDDRALQFLVHQARVGTVAGPAAGVGLGNELGERVVIGLEPGECLVVRLAGLREGDAPEPSGLLTEHDVLGHGEGLHEHEVLVHHADPEGDGVARRADADSLSVDEHLS